MESTGRMMAVGLVIWEMRTSFVRGVTRETNASTTWSAERMGYGNSAETIFTPQVSSAQRMTLLHALYSWTLVMISSPGLNGIDRMTELTPVVALWTKAKSSAGHPRKGAMSRRA